MGIHLVGQLTFKQYFNEKINKGNKVIGIICKLNNIRLHSALLTIYRSFVRPHIGYGDVIYDQFFDYFKNSFIHVLREWNNQQSRKLLLSFIKPICSTPFFIHHPVGVKLLVRLRVGFSHLRGHKFRQNFHYTLISLCSCSFEPETTLHYFWKRNFLILILEKFIYFLIFAEAEFSSSNIFKKIPILSQRKAFLIFPKMEPCIFQPKP